MTIRSANVDANGGSNELISVSCPWVAQCWPADQVTGSGRGYVGVLENR